LTGYVNDFFENHPTNDQKLIGRKMPQGTILAVDDTPANLLLLSQMLAQYGYQVRAASKHAD